MPKSAPVPPVAAVPTPRRRVAARRAQRRVLLAARRHAQESRDARLPQGRERLLGAMTAPPKALEETLYDEIVGRIKQDDSSVPYERGYWYYTRFETGKDYPIYRAPGRHAECARAGPARRQRDGRRQELLPGRRPGDQPGRATARLGRGHRRPPPVHAARQGPRDRRAVCRTRSPNVDRHLVWADDNRTLFYVENDPVTLLGYRVRTHVLGTTRHSDAVVYEENDDSFYMGVGRTARRQVPLIYRAQHGVQRDARCPTPADRRSSRCSRRASATSSTSADHLDGRWVIRTNWQAQELPARCRPTPARRATARTGRELLAHRDDAFIDGFELFDGFLADRGALGAAAQRAHPARGAAASRLRTSSSDEPAYTMGLGDQRRARHADGCATATPR